jgi:opacity protein-like surface antigen
MNKKFMIGGCAAAVVAGNMFAADESISYFAPYASLKAGYAYLGKRNDIKYKGGFAGAVELGVSYDAWRLGLELGYKSNKIKEYNGFGAFGDGWFFASGIKADAELAAGVTINSPKTPGVAKLNAGNWYWKDALHISKVNALTGMVNVCYDYAMTEAWSIYAGLGLGVAKVSYVFDKVSSGQHNTGNAAVIAADHQLPDAIRTIIKNGLNDNNNVVGSKTEFSKTVFAWQLMAGVGYEFNENWKLTLGYKLFNTAKVKLFGDKKIKTPFNHTAELGLTYTF